MGLLLGVIMSLMKELVKGKVKTVYSVDNVEHLMIMDHDKVTAGI